MLSFSALCESLAGAVEFLPDKPEETSQSTARALWFAAAGSPRSTQLALQGDLPTLNAAAQTRLAELIQKRVSGVPLAHLTGRQQFMGLELLAGPEALVPRQETELLAQAAIQRTREWVGAGESPLVVDVCTGSGNVALAIAHRVPQAQVWGADLSPEAVSLAARNADALQLLDRVHFKAGDLMAPFDTAEFVEKLHVLTCNPPYINSAKVGQMPHEIAAFEPRLAFDGGSLGIAILMRLTKEAPRFLRAGGWLVFEVGLGQGPALVKRLNGLASYSQVVTVQDAAGAVRVICAQVKSGSG